MYIGKFRISGQGHCRSFVRETKKRRSIRLVHHATIFEMNTESFRQRAASSNKRAQAEVPAITNSDNQNERES